MAYSDHSVLARGVELREPYGEKTDTWKQVSISDTEAKHAVTSPLCKFCAVILPATRFLSEETDMSARSVRSG